MMLDKKVITIKEFMVMYQISRASYYNLVKTGRAPKRMLINGKVLFTKEAIEEWQKMMEE